MESCSPFAFDSSPFLCYEAAQGVLATPWHRRPLRRLAVTGGVGWIGTKLHFSTFPTFFRLLGLRI